MDIRLIELGCRAMGSKHWRPVVGMVDADGRVVVRVDDATHTVWAYYEGSMQFVHWGGGSPGFLPDLSHPATLGCALHLVREAWNDPDCFAGGMAPGWWQCRPAGAPHPFNGDDEATALILALEGAP